MSKKLPNVMTFSATDATSGAGLQADILTIASLRCNPLSIVTGVSVQDTIGVKGLTAINAELVNDQTRTILEDMEISAFKCGLLGSVENIRIIAEILEDYPEIPLIIDPVLASGRGDDLVNEEMMKAMLELLFPKSYLITPNSHEAKRMVIEGNENFGDVSIDLCAERLKLLGCKNILITGGTGYVGGRLIPKLLEKKSIKHIVLNAKNHEKEAEIIENAGRKNSIIITTSISGRGVDIKLGGQDQSQKEEIKKLGGLFVIGTERTVSYTHLTLPTNREV